MPKRVIDFDALWDSDTLASGAEWAQSEYAWLYGLADASGSFEFTNLRVIWGRVAAIRKNLSLERLQEIFDEFIARGLLFTWEENGKRYGHWTGSDIPGRLPARSWRVRLQKVGPHVPVEARAAYSARFGGSKEGIVLRADSDESCEDERGDATERGLKRGLEEPQAQDWDLGLDSERNLEKQVCVPSQCAQSTSAWEKPEAAPEAAPHSGEGFPRPPARPGLQDHSGTGSRACAGDGGLNRGATSDGPEEISADERTAEELLQIYERERGDLPAAGLLTPERQRRCARWLAGGFTAEEFRAAVRCAAATPF